MLGVILPVIGPGQASAAPLVPTSGAKLGIATGPVYSHRTVTIVNFVGSANCAQLKRIYPTQAANAALCTATLTSLHTDLMPLPGHSIWARVSPNDNQCIGGYQSFDDTYTTVSSSIEMSSTFTWYSNLPAAQSHVQGLLDQLAYRERATRILFSTVSKQYILGPEELGGV